jgi:hypothetical protein
MFPLQPLGVFNPQTPDPLFSLLAPKKRWGKRKALNAGPALGAWSEAVHCSHSDEPVSALPQPGIDPPAGNTGRTRHPAPAQPSGERHSPNEQSAGWQFIHRSSAPSSLSAKSDLYPGRRIAPPDLAQHSTGSCAYERCTAWTEAPRARAALSALLSPQFLWRSKESGVGCRVEDPAGSHEKQSP